MQTHVSSWEELPEGEWLDNDEEGTNWYLANDGTHWHSTENGFTVWKGDETESQVGAKAYDDEMYDGDDEDDEDEEFTHTLPSPRIGVGTALIGIVIALAVIGWTTGFAIPANDENLVMYGENSADFVKENQILIDGLENVQTLNTLTIVLAGGMVIVSALSFFRKSPWWGLSVVNLSLVTVLIMATYTAFSAEKEWLQTCNPQVVYCYLSIMPSLSDMDAIYPAVLSAVGLLIIVNNSFKSWADFDPDEEEERLSLYLLFTDKSLKLGFFPALTGVLMALSVLAWTSFVSIQNTGNTLGSTEYGAYLPDALVPILESIQTLNQMALGLAIIVLLISILTAIKKTPWWLLPTSCLSLICLLLFTAQKSTTLDMTNIVIQDAFYSASCGLLALVVIAISTGRTLMDADWEEYADDSDSISSDYSTGKDFDYFDDEGDDEWRGKVKTVVLSSMLLLAGLGIFATYQYATDDLYKGPEFQIRDAVGNITNESDDVLVVVDLVDRSTMYRIHFLNIEIQINEGEWVRCGYEQFADAPGSRCIFDFLEIFDDNKLTAQESIMISEYGHLCNGEPDEVCKVTVKMTYAYDEQEDYTGPQVLPVLNVNAVSE